MKFFPFPDKLKSFCSQFYYKRKIIKPFQFVISYHYDRDGNVCFTNARRYYRDPDILVDDPLGGTTGQQTGQNKAT